MMKQIEFPLTYKAIELEAYQQNIVRAMLSLRLADKQMHALAADEILLKIDAASCNPSDIAFMQGTYNIVKPLPAIPGFEASGRVVALGNKVTDQNLLGKRVACFTQANDAGTWSEYLAVKPQQIMLHDQQLSISQSAGFFVNPFTAFGMFELALERQSKAIVVNAAGSLLASYLQVFAKQFGMKTIGIVRKQETMQMLLQQGWDEVLNSSEQDFDKKFQLIVNQAKADIAFDAVGGEMTGHLANHLPAQAMIVVYGGLSGKFIGNINPLPLIFREQLIRGFNLNLWLKRSSREKVEMAAKTITELMLEGKVQHKVQIEVDAKDVVLGLKKYLGNMSEGKMLIRF